MKFIKNLLLLMIFTLLISCEGNTDYSFNVQNDSNQSIIVKSVIWFEDTVTNNINSGETLEIAFTSKLGGSEDEGEISGHIQYLDIKSTTGEKCKKELRLHSNWNVETDHLGRVPANYKHTYTIAINNTDF